MIEYKAKEFVVDLPWHAKEVAEYVNPPSRVVRPKPSEDKTYSGRG